MGERAQIEEPEQDPLGSDLIHQRAVLRVLVNIAVPAGLMFAVINYFRGLHFLALGELLFSFTAIYLMRRVQDVRRPRLVVACFAVPIFAIVSYAIYLPGASVTMFAWVYVIPVLAYSGLGEKPGFYLSAAFYTSVGGQFVFLYRDVPAYQEPAAILNVIVCSLAIWGFVHAYERARNLSHQKLSALAETDPLTGLSNRLSLESQFERRRVLSEGSDSIMGLIMVDLDYFKLINDNYGHESGDEVLRRVAHTLRASVREDDIVFRMGGEEFCLIVPRIGPTQLKNTAEAIRTRIQNISFEFAGERVVVTCSIGAVMMGDEFSSIDTMLAEADKRLYRAKEKGRNQVVFNSQPVGIAA